jgi:hypothetical protein
MRALATLAEAPNGATQRPNVNESDAAAVAGATRGKTLHDEQPVAVLRWCAMYERRGHRKHLVDQVGRRIGPAAIEGSALSPFELGGRLRL